MPNITVEQNTLQTTSAHFEFDDCDDDDVAGVELDQPIPYSLVSPERCFEGASL